MRVLVVGAGSTGGYFGLRLAQAGRDVTFLVRPRRAADLRAHGLSVISPHGDLTLTPRVLTAPEIAAPFDAVLLTVKAFQLDAALDDLAPAVGPETMIVPVLNGMRHLDRLAARFGAGATLGGVCRIMATLDELGRVVQLTKLHDLVFGEMDGSVSPRIRALDGVMQGAGFDARLSTHIVRDMWEKWVLLAALGGITCLMRGTVGEVEAAPGGARFATSFLDEVVAVARAAGTPPTEAAIDFARTLLTAPGSAMASSMYRDLQAGRPVEADQIIGDLLARGRDAGVATPLLAAAYTNLAVYQQRAPALPRTEAGTAGG